MTPADRPTGWVLVRLDGDVVHLNGQPAKLYGSLGAACAAEESYRHTTHNRALPTPVWSREAWQRHMAALDSRAP